MKVESRKSKVKRGKYKVSSMKLKLERLKSWKVFYVEMDLIKPEIILETSTAKAESVF